jgi:hypothetical protein
MEVAPAQLSAFNHRHDRLGAHAHARGDEVRRAFAGNRLALCSEEDGIIRLRRKGQEILEYSELYFIEKELCRDNR